MTDVTNQERLVVQAEDRTWPYLWVPFVQIDRLKAIFNRYPMKYYVEDFTVSKNSGPKMIKINFARNTDPDFVQGILDQEQ